MKIILASTSPRRKEILSKTNLDFEVHPADYEEDMSVNLDPVSLVKQLSHGKAQSIAHKHPNSLIIGADTFIVFEDKKLGKPQTLDDARSMLAMLSGKMHSVITGFTLIDTDKNKTYTDIDETKVWFKHLEPRIIEEYVATRKPLDKAGSYGIQEIGHIFVEEVEGDYHNVMGLPLKKLVAVLNTEFDLNVTLLK